jgi:hypothetical protein
MNKKMIAWILIALGALDIIVWFIDGWGWTNYLFGDNVFTKYAWGILIFGGFYMLKKENALYKAKIDDLDLNENETIIHKQTGNAAIVTVTNERVRFRGYSMDDVRKSSKGLPEGEIAEYQFSEIEKVQPVKSSEVAKFKIGKLVSLNWGVQLNLKDGNIINIPISDSELVAKHIEKQLKGT